MRITMGYVRKTLSTRKVNVKLDIVGDGGVSFVTKKDHFLAMTAKYPDAQKLNAVVVGNTLVVKSYDAEPVPSPQCDEYPSIPFEGMEPKQAVG